MALSVSTAMFRDTGRVSAIVDVLRGLVDEVRTESSSAEVGVGAAAVATAVLVVSVLLGRGGDSSVWGSRVGWSALRAAVVAALFVVMGVQVAASGWLTGADTATLQWFVDHRDGTATALARVITDLGSPVGVAAVAVVVSGVSAWRSRSAVPAVFVVGAVGFAAVVSTVTKDVVGRARPPAVLHLMAESDFSFPSGHTTGTTVLVGAVLVLYVLARPRRARTALASVSAAVIVAVVAATRLYLGVHWLNRRGRGRGPRDGCHTGGDDSAALVVSHHCRWAVPAVWTGHRAHRFAGSATRRCPWCAKWRSG
ncbi:phosphatase PAP2 family protein [Nocardia kruczakiae]|uniref:phosphatase PAP2 family protein n=1 Tax=Nocardia kruczakiae TaxID=261477 RepID=UPI0012EDD73D|nr:phosphatase PAP2 family protein [Nocardia kruczakiae]